jgi:hypothetical protein
MNNTDTPEIGEINEVKIFNPETGEDNPIETIDFKGRTDIFEHEDIKERREDGWIVRGFTADVAYKNKKYELTIAGNHVMGYVKIDDIAEFEEGRELLDIMRDALREHFGFRY